MTRAQDAENLRQKIYGLWNKMRKEFGTAGIQRLVGEYCEEALAARCAQVEAQLLSEQRLTAQMSKAIATQRKRLEAAERALRRIITMPRVVEEARNVAREALAPSREGDNGPR
jgi:hypothetical protein